MKQKENNLLLCWVFQSLAKPVHTDRFMKNIKDQCNRQWLRVSISCHRFTNLREIYQGNLSRNPLLACHSHTLNSCLTMAELEELPVVPDNNKACKHSTVVCKVKCNITGKCTKGKPSKHLNTECSSTSVKSKTCNTW